MPRLSKVSLLCSCALLLYMLALLKASESDTSAKHQMSNVEATDMNEMFKFSPEYLKVAVGDTIKFNGSMGQHTVTTVPGMLPERAEKIEIHSIPSKEIEFTKPGIYGVKCRVHNRYGMAALIVAGDAKANLAQAKKFRLTRFGKKKMQQLLVSAENDLDSNN